MKSTCGLACIPPPPILQKIYQIYLFFADFDEFFALCKPEASLFQGKLSKNNAYHHFSAFPPHTSLIFSLNTANQVFARIFR